LRQRCGAYWTEHERHRKKRRGRRLENTAHLPPVEEPPPDHEPVERPPPDNEPPDPPVEEPPARNRLDRG
jgi:hypothetical protein